MPKINIIQLGAQGVDMKSSPLLVGEKRRVHSATNLVFDEGVIRTRPGFVYTTTEAVGQFNGAASFRPRKGISAAPLSESLSGIAVVVDGVPVLGCHPLGESFGCCGDVHVFQAENYLVFQSPLCDTFWWDGMTLTRSPGMNEVDWTEDELPIKEIEHVAPVAEIPDCREEGKESDIELRFLVLDCDTREPISEPVWEIRHNNHKAYSGIGDEEGRFSLNPVPRSYNYDVRKEGYLPALDVPFSVEGVSGEYEFDPCVDPQLIVSGEKDILVLLCQDPDYGSSSSGDVGGPGSDSSDSGSDSYSSSDSGSGSVGSSSSGSVSSSSCPCDPDTTTYYVEYFNDSEGSPIYVTMTGSLCSGYFVETGEAAPGFYFQLIWSGTEWLLNDGLFDNDFLASADRCDPVGYYQYSDVWTAIISATPLP